MSSKLCKGCGRPVVFAKDPAGKWQVLDNVSPCWEQVGYNDGAAQVVRSRAMVSHWVSCPDAYNKPGNRAWEQPPQRDFSEPKEIE